MEGHNPFEVEIEGATLELVGLAFPRRRGQGCEHVSRDLLFVGRDLTVEAFLRFARSLSFLGERLETFRFVVYPSFETATSNRGMWFPTPRAMAFYSSDETVSQPRSRESYFFYWPRNETRAKVIHYLDGRLDWTMQLRMRNEPTMKEYLEQQKKQ